MSGAAAAEGRGALVISLDFELYWGVRDLFPASHPYRANLLGARRAIPQILALFQEFDIAATWASVGFLFATSRAEFESFRPETRPRYDDPGLDPYTEPVGDTEDADPLHFAASLIRLIRETPRQEIASHTWSHYYCLEPGQDREAFRADMDSAVRIAEKHGVKLRSIVFPRNQHNPAYDDILLESGIECYRGNQAGSMYRADSFKRESAFKRLSRLIDSFLPIAGDKIVSWEDLPQKGGLCDVPASLFLRPWIPIAPLQQLRLACARRCVRAAARSGGISHLWWHPHNFGVRTAENLENLRRVLETFVECRERHGMRSMTMHEVAREVRVRRST